jgi:DNA modification methylase
MWEDLRDYRILEGDCIQKMREMPDCSIDAIITDPPYGIGFMNKKWDCSVPGLDWAKECLRVLKPGGHIIAFSSTRTCHRLGVAIEDAGFEIRDTIHWCYFSGFPKNHDISKAIDREAGAEREFVGYGYIRNGENGTKNNLYAQAPRESTKITKPATQDAQKWDGFGTALKPSVEPAILARKPLEAGLTIAQNVLKYGTGGINIDACRFAYGDPCWIGPQEKRRDYLNGTGGNTWSIGQPPDQTRTDPYFLSDLGRWPANLYQCAKPSRGEREAGLDHLKMRPARSNMCLGDGQGERFDGRESPDVANFHPTVKPIKLMRWLCRLIGGKKGSVILDTFCGSGTTGCAAILEGYEFIGIEITSDYLPIIKGRLEWSKEEYMRENAQLSLFEDAI